MKILVLTETLCDFTDVLNSCITEIDNMTTKMLYMPIFPSMMHFVFWEPVNSWMPEYIINWKRQPKVVNMYLFRLQEVFTEYTLPNLLTPHEAG